MTQVSPDGRPGFCDACLGSRRCWVCDGEGTVERRWETADCPSCRTTGRCRYCAPAEDAEPTTIVLDPPAQHAGGQPPH